MQLTVRDLRDLAKRNSSRGRSDLRLAVAEGGDDSGGNDLRSDDLSITGLAGVATTLHDDDLDGRTLWGPRAVVQVEEVAARALIEDSRAAEGEGAVTTRRKTSSEDSASLSRLVKLELVVCGNVTGTGLRILEDSVLEGSNQNAVGRAVTALLFETVSHITWPRWLPLPGGAHATKGAETQQGKQASKWKTANWPGFIWKQPSGTAATMRKRGKILARQAALGCSVKCAVLCFPHLWDKRQTTRTKRR